MRFHLTLSRSQKKKTFFFNIHLWFSPEIQSGHISPTTVFPATSPRNPEIQIGHISHTTLTFIKEANLPRTPNLPHNKFIKEAKTKPRISERWFLSSISSPPTLKTLPSPSPEPSTENDFFLLFCFYIHSTLFFFFSWVCIKIVALRLRVVWIPKITAAHLR